MAKQDEIAYLSKIGQAGLVHALHKPFSDPNCGAYLMEIGAVLSLLPPPPRRLLDVGCGPGWTSVFFARRGYEVVGVDIAPDMIDLANQARDREGLDHLMFQVGDYESLTFDEEFDCAIFFDALHHADDEEAALRMVYRALKPGGICITSEPGVGHARSADAQRAVTEFGVTEKDMPPRRIIALGRQVGFRNFHIYPHGTDLGKWGYSSHPTPGHSIWQRLNCTRLLGSLAITAVLTGLALLGRKGITVLVK